MESNPGSLHLLTFEHGSVTAVTICKRGEDTTEDTNGHGGAVVVNSKCSATELSVANIHL